MLILPHVEQTLDIDYPPGSGDVVGRVEILRLSPDIGYAAVDGYLGDKMLYHKEVNDRIAFKSHEARIQRIAEKAARRIRYDASLIFDLPNAIDLAT